MPDDSAPPATDAPSVAHTRRTARATRRSLFVVCLLGGLPWTVVVYPAGVDLLFPWGLVNSNPWHLTDLLSYLTVYTTGFASLPSRLQAWPIAAGLYLLAVGSGLLSVLRPGRGDPRVTAGLVALAGAVHLQVTAGLARVGEQALPVGAILAFVVAWWIYGRGRNRGRAGR